MKGNVSVSLLPNASERPSANPSVTEALELEDEELVDELVDDLASVVSPSVDADR